jgi:hypothetical protein
MACQAIDWAIQMFGGGGTSNDYGLAIAYGTARPLRIADGPDEAHRNQIARLEMRRHPNVPAAWTRKAMPPEAIRSASARNAMPKATTWSRSAPALRWTHARARASRGGRRWRRAASRPPTSI